jgi:hypothetical protein
MAKRKRSASPFIPNWPDAITMDELRGIRDHWEETVHTYEHLVQKGETRWERHLPIVRERHALWVDLVARRENGEKITSRFYDFLRVQ